MTGEEKLILLCSRIDSKPDRQKLVKDLLKNPIDWNGVISLSAYHGVTPLLYTNLARSRSQDYISKEVSQILKNTYLANLSRNISLWKELSQVLRKIEEAQIKVILFKGAILTMTIYRNPALREFADIDILIKEDDLSRIKNILISRSYEEVKQRYTFLFRKPITQDIYSNLELHTMIVPARPYRIQIPKIWQRSQEKIIYGERVCFPSWEDIFLSSALHIRRHARFLPLRFVCDIAELLNLYKDKLDWNYILNLANINHIKNSVYFCLYISQELLNVFVSEGVIKKFIPHPIKRKSIHLCMNKYNFLKPRLWQGYMLRLLLFDRLVDLFIYPWRMITKKRYRR